MSSRLEGCASGARAESARRARLSKLALLGTAAAVALNLGLLVHFAASTSIWDDEASMLYVSLEGPSRLVELSSAKSTYRNLFVENGPSFHLLKWAWAQCFGTGQVALRMLPLLWWVIGLAGVGVLGRRLGGARGACAALTATALFPNHWLAPISLRYFSMAAALMVWTLVLSLDLVTLPRGTRRSRLVAVGGGLTLVGALLWYTQYIAPIVFAGTGLVALIARAHRRNAWRLAVCWAGIAVLFAPWAPVLLARAHGILRLGPDLRASAATLWVIGAGEFSDPGVLWVSIPAAALAVAFLVAVRRARSGWPPILVGGVLFAAMSMTGLADPRRALMVSVFVSAGVGLTAAEALGALGTTRRPALARLVGSVASGLALTALLADLSHALSKKGWLSVRWLDPLATVVDGARSEREPVSLVTNGGGVAFYGGDPLGKDLQAYYAVHDPERLKDVRVWYIDLRGLPAYAAAMQRALAGSERVAYIHIATILGGGGAAREMVGNLSWLETQGLARVGEPEHVTRFDDTSLRHYVALDELPPARVAVWRMERSRARDSSAGVAIEPAGAVQ